MVILVAVIWVLSLTLGMRETLYQGEPIVFWQKACLSTNSTERSQAITLLQGTILPDLTGTMFHDREDSQLRIWAIDLLNGMPGIEIEYVPAPGRRARAAAALGNFGPPAAPAVPSLIEALNGRDSAVHRQAAIALGKIHSDPDMVIPLLTQCLSGQDVPDAAAIGLAGFGPAARPAVPELLAHFDSRDDDLRKAVWFALQGIDPEAFIRAAMELQASLDEAEMAAQADAAEHTNSPPALNPAQ